MIFRTMKSLAIPIAFALVAGAYALSRDGGGVDSPVGRARTADVTAPSAGDCRNSFLGGRPPSLPAASARGARSLCYDAFAVLHSPLSRTPLWSAEELDPQRIAQARTMERASRFHEEDRLPEDERAMLSDYSRSGYDRGHLAPSGDMPDAQSQAQSFTLANIVPQDGQLNRGPWADLEADVRSLARRRDSVYVVTGVTFEGSSVRFVHSGRVAIPTTMWKAVASPGEGAAVWSAPNGPDAEIGVETVPAFTARTGIDPFPALPAPEKATLLEGVR